jgi:hypothetical protein
VGESDTWGGSYGGPFGKIGKPFAEREVREGRHGREGMRKGESDKVDASLYDFGSRHWGDMRKAADTLLN